MPKLSVSEITTKNWTFEQDVRGYAAAGLDGIGLWRDKLDRYGEELLQAIERTGYEGFYDIELFSEELWQWDYFLLLEECKRTFAALWK